MWIERSLANRHLRGGTLILYDVTSTYVEGKCCALAAFGYNRDRKRGKMQIVYGLLCAADGCPVAVEVFPGNSADPSTLATQISKIRKRFNIHNVALVGDRGMITSARIREDLLPVALDWISALRNADIRKLFKDQKDSEIDTKLCAGELQRGPGSGNRQCRVSRRAAAGVPESAPSPRTGAKTRTAIARH